MQARGRWIALLGALLAAPLAPGPFEGQYLLNGNDGRGYVHVRLSGLGSGP
jgi:hypothetical protein